MLEVSPEKFVVFTDAHEKLGNLQHLLDLYPGTLMVSGGDLIGRGNQAKETIQLCLDNDFQGVWGDWEWKVMSTLEEKDEEIREALIEGLYHDVLRNIYKSYDVSPKASVEASEEFRQALRAEGHDKYFAGLKPYKKIGSVLVVHAGILPNKPWDSKHTVHTQKNDLDNIQQQIENGTVNWINPPIQIADDDNTRLSTNCETPYHGEKTILVTGHYHYTVKQEDRKNKNGTRVRLGSIEEAPLYAYESWTGDLVAVR